MEPRTKPSTYTITSSRRSSRPRPTRLHHLLRWDIYPHSLISNLRRAPFMPPRDTRNRLLPTRPSIRSRSGWHLLPSRVIAASKLVTETCLALNVAPTLCSEARIGPCAFGAEAPIAVMVYVAVLGGFARVAARWIGRGEADWRTWRGTLAARGECEETR